MEDMQINKMLVLKNKIKEKKMKASDLFVKCLEAEGVNKIFGIPGEENADLMISLKKANRICRCRHEQAANIHGRCLWSING